MGNSSGVIIPKPMLAQIGASAGDSVEMTIDAGRLVIAPLRGQSRSGWSDDAKRIAAAGDDALVWPEFANEGDADLKW
ncbi:MAG: AbrB/MazE/SpoVT family DNA-binding domain-containing protein [Alphaproteobacteria bacterium]|nr:AbrB/MazE/SpoVT family DNA-binding domain-containing protein [Alphaproteobacteria bacterium]